MLRTRASDRAAETVPRADEASWTPTGQIALDLETLTSSRDEPCQYALEGEVTDVTRQTIAGRASFRVDPAPWYVGLRRPALLRRT